MAKAGEPDSEKNMKDALYSDLPPATQTPTSNTIDPEDQALAKVCSVTTRTMDNIRSAAGLPVMGKRVAYATVDINDSRDYSPPTTLTGTRTR